MKKITFIACIMALISCKEQVKPNYALISGNISNKLPNDLTINTYDQSYREVVNVSEDGSFVDTLSTETSSYVLYDGKNPVFLHVEPGYELKIDYDAKNFKNSLKISGNGAEISNYLIEKRKLEQKLFGNPRVTYTLDEASYKSKINSIKEDQDSLLKSFDNIPENFVAKEKKNINYNYLRLLSIYEQAHRQLSQKPNFKVSSGFFDELDDLNYNNSEDFEFSHHYKSLVARFYQKKADSLAKNEGIADDLAHLKALAKIDNATIKNGLLFDFANHNIDKSADTDTFYKLFEANSTNEKNNKLIKEKYNKLTALYAGKPSPKFVDYKNYNGGTTSLEDLKGKYIYIDVWATWCGPCIRQIPALKKVEEQYHDKNIEFVSISIDKASDFEKWKTMVNDKELKGVQLFADNNGNSSFVRDYGIQGIPRFILIDPDGNIVNANAPRPSDPELIDLFNKLKI